MNKTAIILAFILYMTITIGNLRGKDYPHAFIWFCYALSLVGFYFVENAKE